MVSEKEIVNSLFEKFNKEVPKSILAKRVQLWQHKELKGINKKYQLRPDIDLLIRTKDNHLAGVEVKVFHQTENKYIFCGIDQALSLLRFGLESVRLIQVFIIDLDADKETQLKVIDKFVEYASGVSDFIRTFNLPLNYTPFSTFVHKNKLIKKMVVLENKKYPKKNLIVHHKEIVSNWSNFEKHSNYRKQIKKYLVKKYLKR